MRMAIFGTGGAGGYFGAQLARAGEEVIFIYNQSKLIPISFAEQILPGTFEYTLNYLIEHEVDVSVFAVRYRHEQTGAPAYDPAVLLKIILYAYARGVVSSRESQRLCRENVVMMALSADSQPHFTTIADFVSSNTEVVTALFRDVWPICDELKLIGKEKEMVAVDGGKLSANVSAADLSCTTSITAR